MTCNYFNESLDLTYSARCIVADRCEQNWTDGHQMVEVLSQGRQKKRNQVGAIGAPSKLRAEAAEQLGTLWKGNFPHGFVMTFHPPWSNHVKSLSLLSKVSVLNEGSCFDIPSVSLYTWTPRFVPGQSMFAPPRRAWTSGNFAAEIAQKQQQEENSLKLQQEAAMATGADGTAFRMVSECLCRSMFLYVFVFCTFLCMFAYQGDRIYFHFWFLAFIVITIIYYYHHYYYCIYHYRSSPCFLFRHE